MRADIRIYAPLRRVTFPVLLSLEPKVLPSQCALTNSVTYRLFGQKIHVALRDSAATIDIARHGERDENDQV